MDLPIGTCQMRFRRLRDAEEDVCMAPLQGVRLRGSVELFAGVLAQGLEHGEARLAIRCDLHAQQTVVHERRDGVEHGAAGRAVAHRFGGAGREAAGKHRQVTEEGLFCRREQVVAPGDRTAERLQPRGQLARSANQHGQAMVQPWQQGLRLQQLGAHRGELDGQREPVQVMTDRGHRGGVLIGEREIGSGGLRPLDEQGHRRHRGESRRGWLDDRVGHGQRQDRKLLLPAQAQGGAAGHQHLEHGTAGQQLGDLRARAQHVLEVVEHEQQPAGRHVLGEAVHQHAIAEVLQTQHPRNRRHDVGRARGGRQVDEKDAVFELIQQCGRDGDREPRLARPTGANEGQQAHVRAAQQRAHLRHLEQSADQRRRLGWQIDGNEVRRHCFSADSDSFPPAWGETNARCGPILEG